MRRLRKYGVALTLAATLLQFPAQSGAFAGTSQQDQYSRPRDGEKPKPEITAQPKAGGEEAKYFIEPASEPQMSRETLVRLLRRHIRYVFIIFNENHSFDNGFGTFPGVNGIYSDRGKARPAASTPGFTQTYTDTRTGATVTVRPFRLGPRQNSSVMDSVDHSNAGMIAKYDVVKGVAKMDGYSRREYAKHAGATPTAASEEAGKQYARLVMSHIDCDTIPFFWQYAGRFTIFDNIFATEDGPSTPNAVAMISGQVGQTQWVKHPGEAAVGTAGAVSCSLFEPPLIGDPQPFWGSQYDTTAGGVSGPPPYARQPAGVKDGYANNNITANFTFASLPLTFQGKGIAEVLGKDPKYSTDTADIAKDIPYIEKYGSNPVNWGWFQEGYGLEATDTGGVASHFSYVSHHNGAQYFGYVSNTPGISASMHGLTDFFTEMAHDSLPRGGVFYIRGGYKNLLGKKPVITDPETPADEIAAIDAAKAGDDDHPGYTDRQLSEAMAARVINAVASNPKIWSQSAIIITYDETDGQWDHVSPRILSYGPNGLLARGSRVPLILISPYARTHVVSHVEGDHNSVIETINYIFGLPALASLPDEAKALKDGDSPAFNKVAASKGARPGFRQTHLGPNDVESSISGSLLSGFDPRRLSGKAAPLPASLAIIPDRAVNSFPHYDGQGCKEIGITPEDVRLGIANDIPGGFNPLPGTFPAGPGSDARTY